MTYERSLVDCKSMLFKRGFRLRWLWNGRIKLRVVLRDERKNVAAVFDSNPSVASPSLICQVLAIVADDDGRWKKEGNWDHQNGRFADGIMSRRVWERVFSGTTQ